MFESAFRRSAVPVLQVCQNPKKCETGSETNNDAKLQRSRVKQLKEFIYLGLQGCCECPFNDCSEQIMMFRSLDGNMNTKIIALYS